MTGSRMVIGILGGVLTLATVLIGLLAYQGTPTPDVLQNIAIGSLTGLVGVLVPRPGDTADGGE